MFQVIQKINSVLFLLILLVGIGSIFYFTSQSAKWKKSRAVEVAKVDGSGEPVELRMGRLKEIDGHNSYFVELYNDSEGGKFSGYTPSKTRNILFLIGDELNSSWLFDNNRNLIEEIKLLKQKSEEGEETPVNAIYLNVVKEDTNFDGLLSNYDRFTIALVKPDGSQYTELVSNINQVMDYELSSDSKSIAFICQIQRKVVILKYSLISFQKESERVLANVGGKL
ncbi:hypothetical protein [Microbulbifer sp. THAF38]|uniref:hypothetical protein n=1 Tax=Microbulbifer sp. THAF38 TaxID=2587856 RepID=UPI0012690A5B|nr:hypothetical protein [Microbulbifer sp. THAF38]QFT54217.1 hypothetical protein FIU95_06550 [Microbulbifer sp. THAF38]